MWNISKSDKRYYDRIAIHEEKQKKSMAKANARGEAAVKWMETNKLTPETKPEFDRLMKEVDRNFGK